MAIKQRLIIIGIVASLFLTVLVIAISFSPQLIAHIVEHTLLEKAPEGTDPERLSQRFRDALNRAPDEEAQLQLLLTMASRLEKVPRWSPQELSDLLGEIREERK
jgi:hypothetical protein